MMGQARRLRAGFPDSRESDMLKALLVCTLSLAATLTVGLAHAAPAVPPPETHPTVPLRDLPAGLKAQYLNQKPEMNANSRCAAAFDSYSEDDKMTLRCSIYIKLGAVGARRSMGYCEEQREKLRIHAPCRIVVD
jgi:hypothetical protein